MKAVVLEQYDNNIIKAIKNLKILELDDPVPKDDEILIQVEASPINPSDIAFLRGGYNIVKPLPTVPGFECSGLVIDAGKNPDAQALMGKRVSCFTQGNGNGTWAQLFISKASDCIVIKDKMDIDQAACLFINPFTAWALYQKVKKSGCHAFVQNAANGQVGRFLRNLAKMDGINVINIVRKDEHIDELKKQGESYVLNCSTETFAEELATLSRKLKANLALDAVGGELSGKILNNMPDGTKLIVYGGLGGTYLENIEVLPLIFKRKSIEGFNLNDVNAETPRAAFDQIAVELQNMIIAGKLETKIQRSIRLQDISRGLILYISKMSKGKILIKPMLE